MTNDPNTIWILANDQSPVLQALPTQEEPTASAEDSSKTHTGQRERTPTQSTEPPSPHEPTSLDEQPTGPIPLRPETHNQDDDWRAEGERDFDLSIITGQTGDDDPEQWIARNEREELRDQLADLDADQLRDYIDGLHTGMETFFFRGL